MRAKQVRRTPAKALILGVLCLLARGLANGLDPAGAASSAAAWEASPYRNFGPEQALAGGRAVLRDEADDAGIAAAVGSELRRIAVELHEKQGWRVPLADGDPLRIFIARKDAEGVRRLAVRGIDSGHLVAPAIQLDATGLSARQIVHEVGRLYAFATLSAYGALDRTFVTQATAEYLAGHDGDEEREAARLLAAAPAVDLATHADSLGRLYVEEFARAAGGPAALRGVWEKAAETAEEPLGILMKSYTETTGAREDALLLRFSARLYATLETEASPSRVSLADLETQGLDAATPVPFTLRHRTFLPSVEAGAGALRVAWPDQGAGAAAIIRYREASLLPDVVFLAPGSTHTIPLSGASRVDFVVAATSAGPPLFGAIAMVERVGSFPFAGLAAQAVAGPGQPRVTWTTSSHEALSGWAVFREEVLADGRISRSGPEIVPSSRQGEESFRYVYVDSEASPATFYRYTVWAVTEDGVLARAFSATLRTAD
jgi:hypothetical protein